MAGAIHVVGKGSGVGVGSGVGIAPPYVWLHSIFPYASVLTNQKAVNFLTEYYGVKRKPNLDLFEKKLFSLYMKPEYGFRVLKSKI